MRSLNYCSACECHVKTNLQAAEIPGKHVGEAVPEASAGIPIEFGPQADNGLTSTPPTYHFNEMPTSIQVHYDFDVLLHANCPSISLTTTDNVLKDYCKIQIIRSETRRTFESFSTDATLFSCFVAVFKQCVFLEVVTLFEADRAHSTHKRTFVRMRSLVVLVRRVLREFLPTNFACPVLVSRRA